MEIILNVYLQLSRAPSASLLLSGTFSHNPNFDQATILLQNIKILYFQIYYLQYFLILSGNSFSFP